MAPKSEDLDWTPLTPGQKARRNRGTALKSEDDEGKGKALLHVHQSPPKKRRGMRKRRLFHELEAPGCLYFSWVKRERSNNRIRRRNLSALTDLLRVLNDTNPLEEHMIDKEIISIRDRLVQPLAKVYERRKNRTISIRDRLVQPMAMAKVYKRRKNRSEEIKGDDCDGHSLDLQPELKVYETQVVNLEDGCDGMSSQVNDEPTTFIDESKSNHENEEANAMSAELKENSMAWAPLEKFGASEKGNSSSSSSKHDDFIPNSTVTDRVPSNCEHAESLIDILKKRIQIVAVKTPNKKMKRHNPKVVHPSPSPLKPRTPNLARIPKKKTAQKKFSEGKRKKISRRKLDFDGECSTMEQAQDRLPQLQQIWKKRRSMRKKVSVVKLNNLIRSIRETMSSSYLADGKDAKELKGKKVKSVMAADFGIPTPVLVKSLANISYHSYDSSNSNSNSRIRPENILLIQDEALFQAVVEDFLVKRMESLHIDDGLSKFSAKEFGVLALSKNKKNNKKGPVPNVKLDEDTMKVWNMLMASNWSESAESETLGDEDYMNRQRKLFRERLERFISIMRGVHGTMEFKAWKGSVLDSIVGVYLTQNVGDNSSSTAFMTLRAKYPPLSLSQQNELYCSEHTPQIQFAPENVNVSDGPAPEAINDPAPEAINDPEATKEGKRGKKKKEEIVDWDLLRRQYSHGISRKRTEHSADSVNWETIRQVSEQELASVIHRRGMNNQLAKRIKDFLDRMMKDHGSLDLEWLRHVPPLKAKDFLMSIKGLALKSTECVRLLALQFPAFPVDTNAGRFFVRIGWVPLQPLPEDVQLHLLNNYPVLESIQKYIWPRVCDNGHPLLYEAHCHTITFAKTFCTKTKPNCNECPMRGECNHFASAHASAKLRLEGPPSTSTSTSTTVSSQEAPMITNVDESRDQHNSEPIIEFPPSPVAEAVLMEPSDEDIETVQMEALDGDIEDIGLRLSGREFSKNLHSFVSEDDEILKALVPLDPRLGSVPMPKHKIAIRLRTIHKVYELPDSHPLLRTFEKREPNDPSPYLLAIWTTDEEAGSMCLSGEVARYEKHRTIKGTILIPCLTANKGAFPLNATYFQPHEVFADHETSEQPIDVPTNWIWNLNKRFLYCGTSLAAICRGMSLGEVAYSFQRSVICVRGFDRKTRYPCTLANKFHYCKSRQLDKSF